jgi:hypothetical protein
VQSVGAAATCPISAKSTSIYLAALVLALTGLSVYWVAHSSVSHKPLPAVALGDGRILQIEAVTYGTNHHVGNPASEVLRRLQAWLPRRLLAPFEPKYPQSVIDSLDHPALVVWVNAISAKAGTNVDCQGVRVELVDQRGQHYAEDNSSWFGGDKFWRVGHLFHVFPRNQAELTMQVSEWRKHQTNEVHFPNPHLVQPAAWTGLDLPQQQQAAGLTIVLSALRLLTNGIPPNYYSTLSVCWEPVWELRRDNALIGGWDQPEWFAEDPTGNRGQDLGTNQTVLRFSATFYPLATNAQAAQCLATLPQIALTNLQSILWWNRSLSYQSNNISILGLFPAGDYVFCDGAFLTNPPVPMGPVHGGAPSGWTGRIVAVNPLKQVYYHGHYSTTDAVIYVSAANLGGKSRLAIRLRDAQGRSWVANPEPQGAVDGIYPFLLDLPPDVNQVTPELVLLKPLEAQFTVKVPSPTNP